MLDEKWEDILKAPPHEHLRDAVVLGLWSVHTYGNWLSRPFSKTWTTKDRERFIKLAARMVNNFEATLGTDASQTALEAAAQNHGIEAVKHGGFAGRSYTAIACRLIQTFRMRLHLASAKSKNMVTMFDYWTTIDEATIDGEELAENLAKSPIEFDLEWLVETVKNELPENAEQGETVVTSRQPAPACKKCGGKTIITTSRQKIRRWKCQACGTTGKQKRGTESTEA